MACAGNLSNLQQKYAIRVYFVVEFFETDAFVRIINDYLNDEELRLLQIYLLNNPDSRKVIKKGKGSGAAKALLRVAAYAPDVVLKALSAPN